MSEPKEMPLYTYNRAAGMAPAAAAHAARTKVILMYAMLFQSVMMVVFFGSFLFVLTSPMYAHSSGFDRMKAIGWILVGGMALASYFPIKAKSITFWVLYAVMLWIVAQFIVINS